MAENDPIRRTLPDWTKTNQPSHRCKKGLPVGQLSESRFGKVAESHPTARTFIVLSRRPRSEGWNWNGAKHHLKFWKYVSEWVPYQSIFRQMFGKETKVNFRTSSVTSQICRDMRARIREKLRLYIYIRIETSNALFYITPNSCHSWNQCRSSNNRFDASWKHMRRKK